MLEPLGINASPQHPSIRCLLIQPRYQACDNDLSRAADYYYYYYAGDQKVGRPAPRLGSGVLSTDNSQARDELRWDGSLFHAPRGGVEADTQDGHSYNNNYQPSR